MSILMCDKPTFANCFGAAPPVVAAFMIQRCFWNTMHSRVFARLITHFVTEMLTEQVCVLIRMSVNDNDPNCRQGTQPIEHVGTSALLGNAEDS